MKKGEKGEMSGRMKSGLGVKEKEDEEMSI